jgi:cytochrome c-type biogenesis protein CcmE
VKPKNQRLTLIGLAMLAVIAAVLLAMSALRDQAAYFYAPGDIAEQGVPEGRAIRIGGMVQAGSRRRGRGPVRAGRLVRRRRDPCQA